MVFKKISILDDVLLSLPSLPTRQCFSFMILSILIRVSSFRCLLECRKRNKLNLENVNFNYTIFVFALFSKYVLFIQFGIFN